jgi:hypothetical protein
MASPPSHPATVLEVAQRCAAVKGSPVLPRGRSLWVRCPCPGHPDLHPSLEIRCGGKQPVVVKCWSKGCSVAEVLEAAGLTWSDVCGPPTDDGGPWVVTFRCPDHPSFDCLGDLRADDAPRTALSLRDRAYREERAKRRKEGLSEQELNAELEELERAFASDVRHFTVEAPKGARKVMLAVLADLVDVVNERMARGEHRSMPYGSRWAAGRLGLDARRVREALRSLVKAGVLIEDGGLPWPRTPCFRVAVAFPCPRCLGLVDEHGRLVIDEPEPEPVAVAPTFPDVFRVFCEDEPEPAPLTNRQRHRLEWEHRQRQEAR